MMTFRDLAYWLQGFKELAVPLNDGFISVSENPEQRDCILRHIALVRTLPQSEADEARLHAVECFIRAGSDSGLFDYIGSYFQHVVDVQHPDPVAASVAHDGPPSQKIDLETILTTPDLHELLDQVPKPRRPIPRRQQANVEGPSWDGAPRLFKC